MDQHKNEWVNTEIDELMETHTMSFMTPIVGFCSLIYSKLSTSQNSFVIESGVNDGQNNILMEISDSCRDESKQKQLCLFTRKALHIFFN